jgi:hypothetical protein
MMVNPFELEPMRPNPFRALFATLRQHGYGVSLSERPGILTIREPGKPKRDMSDEEVFGIAKRLMRDTLPR